MRTSVDSRAAGTCLFLSSFVLHFEKERETEIAASAFQNYIWRHFLNVCHTFDQSVADRFNIIEEMLETRDVESITARFITKLL